MRAVLIGTGELIGYVARQARGEAHSLVLVVDSEVEASRLAAELDATVVVGDGSDPAVLRDVEANLADLVVALTPRDQDNLVACQVARRFFGVPRTIALVNDPDNRPLFERLGVGQVVSAAEVLGAVIRQESGFAGIVARLGLRVGGLGLLELQIGPGAPAVGRALHQLKLPQGALVVGILRGDQVFVPRGSDQVEGGDELLVVVNADAQEAALAALVGRAQ